VQVGDPFTEKLLLEACLELMATDAIVAIQDMGAAGLTSSSVEMAGKGGLGIELDLDKVPTRETGMSAYEIMLSESQERMLMVLKPGAEAEAQRIFERWELDCATIGRVTDSGRIVLRHRGQVVCDLPLGPLVDEAPLYDRPHVPTAKRAALAVDQVPPVGTIGEALLALIATPDLCSKRWIWEQYDHLVTGQTVQRPGGDAAVVRLEGSAKALAMTTDCTPRYCVADPELGGAQAVVETWRNLCAVGATPLAITDNLNFGNPERPEIMGQLVGCVRGMGAACRALDYPVISGNVSLYNETNGKGILPTPVVGGVGLLADAGSSCSLAFKAADESVIVLGETTGWLGCSLYLRTLHGREDGAPPPLDLAAERRRGELVRRLIQAGQVTACHDVSDGGLLVALAEMAVAGGLGAELEFPADLAPHAFAFGEDQGRYVVTARDPAPVLAAAQAAGVPARLLGRTGGPSLTVSRTGATSVGALTAAYEGWLPAYMAAPVSRAAE
jgi:phosphoribosylformylglycinamidine synthase